MRTAEQLGLIVEQLTPQEAATRFVRSLSILGLLPYTAGTPTLRDYLREESIRYGYNAYDTDPSQWPRDLGIDLDRGKFGVFEREGARRYELEHLLLHEQLRIAIGTDVDTPQDLRERAERFVRWTQEFEELYGEPYDSEANLRAVFGSAEKFANGTVPVIEAHARFKDLVKRILEQPRS